MTHLAASPLLALAAGSVLDGSALDVVEAASAAGFDAVGFRLSGEHRLDAPGVVRVRDRAAALGLAIHDVEVHRISTQRPDPRPLLEQAAAVGARHALVVSDAADVELTRGEIARAVRAGAQVGVSVAVEYMAWTTPSGPGKALRMAEETGCRVVVDLLHHVRVGAGPEELAALVTAGVVGWVQVCDAPLDAPRDLLHEARHDRLPPGEGGLPLADLLAVVPPEVAWSVEVQSDALTATLPVPERARRLADATRSLLARRSG